MGNGFVNIQDFIGNPNSANTLIGPNTPSHEHLYYTTDGGASYHPVVVR